MILYKEATKIKIKVSDFRMAFVMHLTQFHSLEPSYLFDKDYDTKCRRKKVKRTWHENFAEYRKKNKQLGSKIAKNRTKKVTTYCPDCIDEPHLYLKCFNTVHR